MSGATYRFDEAERLEVVRKLEIAGTSYDPALSALTEAAASICNVPTSLVTVLDDATQWFVAQVGIESTSTPREHAFCDVAIRQPDELFEVPDTLLDPRFVSNPLVTADPHIRFYAGVPIRPLDNHAVGTLCLVSDTPKDLNDFERDALRRLGLVAEQLFRLRIEAQSEHRLRVSAIDGLAHDLGAPLASIRLTAESLATQSIGGLAQRQVEQLAIFAKSAEALVRELRSVGDPMTGPSASTDIVDLDVLVNEVIATLGTPERVSTNVLPIRCRIDPWVVIRSLSNLINNALLHTEPDSQVVVHSQAKQGDLQLTIQDDGPGLPPEVDLHIRTYGNTEHIPPIPELGLGIIVAHSLARTYGGSLRLESRRGTGTRLTIELPGVVLTEPAAG